MLPDLEKILVADRQGQEKVAQARQEALDLKNRADAQVGESQARLQADEAQVRQGAQADILAAAEARAGEIAAATGRQVQELTDMASARRDDAVAWLVNRVLGT
jgi:hypothetical protein